MPQQTVPIPGQILKTTVIFGLTFDELIVLAALPLVLVLPSAFFDFIPLWFTIGTVFVGFIGVLGIVLKTPEGQSPVEWFPAFLDRKLKPEKYVLKPKDNTKYGSPDVQYQNVVHTANLIEEEADEPTDSMLVMEFTEEIDGADRLDLPEWADENPEESTSPFGAVIEKVKP